jgi:hypothetical protein
MKTFSTRKLSIAIAVFMAVVAMGSSASAETLAAFATRVSNDNDVTTHVFKALNDAGATSLAFKTTAANRLVKITYNAECGVLGPAASWVSVTVLVDGVEANPQNNTDFAMCTSTGTGSYLWVGAVRQSLIRVPAAGTHNVQIVVDLLAGATNWWLGDTSLVVETQ